MRLSFEDAIRRVRDRYIAHFRACIAELETEGRVEPECKALDEHGKVVVDGPLDLAYRHDAALIANDRARTFTFESTTLESFEPFSHALGSLTVYVRPFHWDYCEATIEPAISVDSLEPFGEWFREWFRANAEPVDGTVSAVHFASDPDLGPDSTRLLVGLGTAPVEALVSLLVVLRDCGAERISLAAVKAA